MNETLKAIALADDRSIVRAFEHFHRALSDLLNKPLDELTHDLSGRASELVSLFAEREDESLSAGASIALARWVLVEAAHSGFAPVALRCLKEWSDDRQSVGKILTIGLVGTVWLVVATTNVQIQGDSFQITKHGVDPGVIDGKARAFQIEFGLQISADPKADGGCVNKPDRTVKDKD